jgi:hypothetical protein
VRRCGAQIKEAVEEHGAARPTAQDAQWELEKTPTQTTASPSGTWLSGGARPQLGVSPR